MSSAEINDFVERVNERTDIYAVVSRYVQLTQKGGRYWGCCPFHSEKTASFSVSADKGLFYCFGCGAGGNAFKFLSLIENISYFDAVKLQAERLGIDLPKRKLSPEEENRFREEKILLKINSIAQDFYHECLIRTARGEVGRKYLAQRGITPETISTFRLGFAPEEWEELLTHLTRQDFTPQQIEAAGLAVKRTTSGYYDKFRSRVMIPISDVRGRVVGFGGRILTAGDENTPKYLNSPETALFNKRKLLFGLDKSNRAITKSGTAIVVEGYMDAISLFSAGVQNVVATLGTAFTPEHANLIVRYAKKVIFCYDSDEAGQNATVRALPIVQAVGAEVFVVQVPDGKDPDEFIRNHSKSAFDELVKNALPLIDYRIKFVIDHADLSSIYGRIRALQDILPVVVPIRNPFVRSEYRKQISARLVLDEDLVREEWQKFVTKRNRERREPERIPTAVKREKLPAEENPLIREACEVILRMAWHESEIIDYVMEAVPMDLLSTEHREIIAWLKACSVAGIHHNEIRAANELKEGTYAQLSRLLMDGTDEPRDTELAIFYDAINFLKRTVLKRKYETLLTQMPQYQAGDSEAYNKTLQEVNEIRQQLYQPVNRN